MLSSKILEKIFKRLIKMLFCFAVIMISQKYKQLMTVHKWKTYQNMLTLAECSKNTTIAVQSEIKSDSVQEALKLPKISEPSNPQNKSRYRDRAQFLRDECYKVYGEELPKDFNQNCRKYQGYDSFMISPTFMMSVPNKCASQYLNQLSFGLLGLTDGDLKPGTGMYSYRSSVR